MNLIINITQIRSDHIDIRRSKSSSKGKLYNNHKQKYTSDVHYRLKALASISDLPCE